MTAYRDFDLLVGRSGEAYAVRILASPAGQASAEISGEQVREIARLAAEFAALVSGAADERQVLRLAKELGGKLYDALFQGSVGRIFAASRQQAGGLRIKLRLALEPEVSRWPWEYLYDRELDRFLALSAATPIVRYPELAAGERPVEGRAPLSVLAVAASPLDLPRLRADRELERIAEALAPLVAVGDIVLERLPAATFAALTDRLDGEDVQVLHFIGHGAFDASLGEGALLFEGSRGLAERVSEDRLSALLLDHPAVRLVFLNACDGARHDEYDGFGGVAQRLLQQGVPAVIAMQRAISDRAATLFSSTFYAELARGVPIDAAVAKGRRAMRLAGHAVAWGAPVLYLRAADGVLFSRPAGERRAADRSDDASPAVPPRRRRGLQRGALAMGGIVLALLAGLAYRWRVPRTATDAENRPSAAVPRAVPRSPECPSPRSPEILFVRIPPGAFEMGSTRSKDEQPIHRVTLTRAICLGAFEITRAEWEAVMGPDREVSSARDGQLPKVGVSWEDVQVFLERLNGQAPGRDFRLPTEAQWEYAARAGTATRFSFGDDAGALYLHANCRSRAPHDDGYDDVAPVGAFPPNPWGLFDMEGNAREWVQDRFGHYPAGPVVDPQGAPTGELRVRRGGGWNSAVESCEPTHRTGSRPSLRKNDLGFRIAAEPVK